MDNPLSQNPDSMWGQFFHKAELEKMVDQDLSRLYPEHGSYFQTPKRQGMHEPLAPLLYVLQDDLVRLSEVRKLYKDYFTDNFDGLSFNVTDISYSSDLENEEDIGIQKEEVKVHHLNDFDPNIQTIISFSDAYGAEGELGVVLSEKFIEHDANSMFDVLMNGDEGAVAMASFFSHSPSSENGLPHVIEASSLLYHILSTVDLSLYSHLVELGVEPQYFALRWLRVLFGREFALVDLLVIWDEIFALDNNKLKKESEVVTFRVFNSLTVSMILYLRSSLLATENATSCLQRLLNFPEDVNLGKLIKKAKSLMNLAIGVMNSIFEPVFGGEPVRPGNPRGHHHSHSSDLTAQTCPHGLVMNKEEEEDEKPVGFSKQVGNQIRGWSEKVKARLSRVTRSTVRRNLADDQPAHIEENQKLVSETENCGSEENSNSNNNNNPSYSNSNNNRRSSVESNSSIIENEPGPGLSLSPSPSIESGLYKSTEDFFHLYLF